MNSDSFASDSNRTNERLESEPGSEYRRSVKRTTTESHTTESETIDSRTGDRFERRTVESEIHETKSVSRTEIFESGPLHLGSYAPGSGAASWPSPIPRRVLLVLDDVVAEGCPDAAELSGDYLLELVEQTPLSCRWEYALDPKCGLDRAVLTAKLAADGLVSLLATITGSTPGPRWAAADRDALRETIELRFDHAGAANPVAGCLWPERVLARPLGSGAGAVKKFSIPAEPTAGELAAMGRNFSSGSSYTPPPEPPPTPPCEDDTECCECGCSEAPVRYSSGEVQLAVTDLEVGGFGKNWGHRRVYSNRLSPNGDLGNGFNWLVEQWPYLIEHEDNSITVVRGTRGTLWFDLSGGNYVGRYGAKSSLKHDATSHIFVLALPTGEQWTFHDFDQATYPEGLLKSQQTAGGQATNVTSYSTDGHIGEIQRSITVAGTTTTESFLYTYSENGQVGSLTLRRQENGGSWNQIRKVVYEYYNSSESFGSLGDLKRVRIQVPQGISWADSLIHYYRYYTSGEPSGFIHGLKYIVKPNTYASMIADSIDPLTATNGVIAQYADQYLQYDPDRRVVLETLDGGSRTYTFSYTPNITIRDFNNWALKTLETRPDGSQFIVYTNHIGQILLKELRSGPDSWISYYHFDSAARKTLAANPSAVQSYDDNSPDLGVVLRANTGLIRLTDYYSTTGSGAAEGYIWNQKIQQGSGGLPVVLRSYTYTSRSAGNATVYPVAQKTVYRNDNGTGAIVTSYAYTWYPASTQVQQRSVTLPSVPTSQNGSGFSNTTQTYYDITGNQTWNMDERGFITAFEYDLPSGAVARRIDDVDTTLSSGAPSGWITPAGGGLNLITDFENDELGRTTQELGPRHTIDLIGTATSIRRAKWTVYQDLEHEEWIAQGYATGPVSSYVYTLINPVAIFKRDAGGKTREQIQATRSLTSGRLMRTDTFPQSSYVRWTTFQYTQCCLAASQRVYHTIPATGTGSSGTNYDETGFGYDVMKRRNRTVSPGGTIKFEVFDVRDNLVATYIGTNDTGATEADPTGGGASGNNMVVVAERQYDEGQAGGDNNLTLESKHVDATTSRLTTYIYDWRNRLVDTDGEIDFYQKITYDNLDQAIRTDRHNTSANGNLIGRSETRYDDRGRIYQTIAYAVDPSTGAVGNALTDNTWYDATDHSIKVQPAGSQLFTKRTYDSLGRSILEYKGYGSDSTYADVQSVANNTILEQTETYYDEAGNTIQTTHRQRYHNAPPTQFGSLGDPATTPKARITYTITYPDPLGRLHAAADYGTNGGAALTRLSTIPVRSDSTLVTTTDHNDRGEAYQVTDPKGRVDRTVFDHDGREITYIENYITGNPGTGTSDQDRTTRWSYTPDGQIATMTAVNVTTGDQTTTYVYGTTIADSGIATSLLKRYEVYPDSVGSNDRVAFTYNRQQEPTTLTDQTGTVHSYDYDLLGRRTEDRITTMGPGVDGAVRRIATAYEVRGMVQLITSHDNPVVGQGNVINQVRFAYDTFSQLTDDYQSHNGVVNTSLTPRTHYSYADGTSNSIRPTSLTYPNGRVLTFYYGTAGSLNESISRVTSLIDNDGTTHLANYSYLGLDAVVEVIYPQPQVEYTLIDLSGTNDPDTGDIYSGFDRFGRIKDSRWHNTSSATDTDRIKYGYDRVGNRIWRQNTVATSLGKGFDELYSYDGLHRLVDTQRGTLSTSKTAIIGKTFGQAWTLDGTGNWSGFNQDDDGDGSWDLVQNRTSNSVNEITAINNPTGSAWITPQYDAAGNMTTFPDSSDPSSSIAGKYDAWNRLVLLSTGTTPVREYRYDGITRQIINRNYSGGSPSQSKHFYFGLQWRTLEVTDGTLAERQFLWGLRYIDDLVLRDSDTAGTGTLTERIYGHQDANWNMVALSDNTGLVQERFAYDAYGALTALTEHFDPKPISDFDWDINYAGYRWDSEVSLYEVRNRNLHPLVGWLQRDPEGYTGGLSLYLYVGNSPLNAVDPLGLFDMAGLANSLRAQGAGACTSADLLRIPLPYGASLHVTVTGCVEMVKCCQNKAVYNAWKILVSAEGYVQWGIRWQKPPVPKGTRRNQRVPDPWRPGKTIKSKKRGDTSPGTPGFRDRTGHVDGGPGISDCPQVPSWDGYGTAFLRGTAGAICGLQFNISKSIRSLNDAASVFSGWSAQGSASCQVSGLSLEAGLGFNGEGWFALDGPMRDEKCCD